MNFEKDGMDLEGSLPSSVLVVCLGNICRSPAGEYLLRNYAKKSKNNDIKKIVFDSAGLSAWSGPMYHNSEKYLHEKGISTANFCSKQINAKLIEKYDLILVMERDMASDVIAHIKNRIGRDSYWEISKKIKTFKEAAGEYGDIEDPYMMSKKRYWEIIGEIDRLSRKIIQKWERLS